MRPRPARWKRRARVSSASAVICSKRFPLPLREREKLARWRRELVQPFLSRLGTKLRHRHGGDEQQDRQAGEHRGQAEAVLHPQDRRQDEGGREAANARSEAKARGSCICRETSRPKN